MAGRGWVPETSNRSLVDPLLVDADLPIDQVEAVLEFGKLGFDSRLMFAEQGQPLLLISGALPYQCCKCAQARQRHPRGSQPSADPQPINVLLVIDAAAGRGATDLREQQIFPFVEPQRVHAQTGVCRDFADIQLDGACVLGGHGFEGTS